eukprot:3720455-Pyramimonas_sp.AAC.1
MGQSFRVKGPMAFPQARPFGPVLEKHWDHNSVRAQIDMSGTLQGGAPQAGPRAPRGRAHAGQGHQ